MSDNKITVPSGLTEDMIQAAVENPGTTISAGSATSSAPKTSVPISGYGSNLRPVVKGNDKLIVGPSSNFGGRLAKQAQQFAESESQRIEEINNEMKALSPQALRRDVEALRRALKRAEKKISELEAK